EPMQLDSPSMGVLPEKRNSEIRLDERVRAEATLIAKLAINSKKTAKTVTLPIARG
ncbi:MAG: hypothetical protein QOF63_341, partial [Thermoanaerobaculia bacterium]|nr:hypothetical protein [Thermoanaerobaculia bacterium]